MPAGVLFAFGAYFVWACGDVAVKALGTGLPLFEIAFFSATFSMIPLALFRQPGDRWREMFKMKRPLLVHARAIVQLVTTFCIIISFTTIPFAEVYAVVFLTPIVVVLVSVLVLGEQVPWQRWVLMATSFAAVLFVVRPGFRELHVGHLTALIAIFSGTFNMISLRLLAGSEQRVTLIGTVLVYSITVFGLLMLPVFVWPEPSQWLLLMGAGLFGGSGHLLILAAIRRVGASDAAPTQYSQMLWALLFGALFFNEFPDAIALLGLVALVLSGLGIVLVDRAKRRRASPPA